MNMTNWIKEIKSSKNKKPLPILSFPCTSLLGISINELLSTSDSQALGIVEIAKRIPSSAAVSFMDLSVEAECFGAKVRFSENEIPSIANPVIDDISNYGTLPTPHVGDGRTKTYIEGVKKAADVIKDRPVFAGMIGPFSLAARLLGVSEAMMACYDDEESVKGLLSKLCDFLIEYALAFKSAGADGIIIAEPVAGMLSPTLESEFSTPFMKTVTARIKADDFAVIYHNCGDNTEAMLDSILSIRADGYHFGNTVNMKNILSKTKEDVLIMGNIDPVGILRAGNPESIKSEVSKLMKECSEYNNFILSSGCDMPYDTPWENIDAFFEACIQQ